MIAFRGTSMATSGSASAKHPVDIASEVVRAHDFDLERVSPPIRSVYLISRLEFEITLGSVEGWLTNSSGRWAHETVAALEEIGAARCAALVREMLRWLPAAALRDETDRMRAVRSAKPRAEDAWRRAADELLEWPDDLEMLIAQYAAKHPRDVPS
jgi:hypothetical protein